MKANTYHVLHEKLPARDLWTKVAWHDAFNAGPFRSENKRLLVDESEHGADYDIDIVEGLIELFWRAGGDVTRDDFDS